MAKTNAPWMPTEKVDLMTPPETAIPQKPLDTLVFETLPDTVENLYVANINSFIQSNMGRTKSTGMSGVLHCNLGIE